MIGQPTAPVVEQPLHFQERMAVLNSLPASTGGQETARLAMALNPNLRISADESLGKLEGRWDTKGIQLPLGADKQTIQHELAHGLGYRTGITPAELGRGTGKYAKYGSVPRDVAEGAADVLSGTRGYLPDLSIAKRSQARSVAEMILAAAKEDQTELARQIMKGKMK